MGGQIDQVDTVADRLSLKVPGSHSVKILFDERTQIYQDGKKISILGLHPEDHASVETTLDGTAIFALRIHLLSNLPDGRVRGQIVSFDPAKNELKLRVTDSTQTVELVATPGTPIVRVGQDGFTQQQQGPSDLVSGAVVDVSFRAATSGSGVASRVEVLAVPGAEFLFRGNLSFLDLRAGRMSISNLAGDESTDVSFDPSRFGVTHDLQQGSAVKVTAHFDGARYVASSILLE
jgi:hypothetical protein